MTKRLLILFNFAYFWLEKHWAISNICHVYKSLKQFCPFRYHCCRTAQWARIGARSRWSSDWSSQIGWSRKCRKLLILRDSAPINGKSWCLYNWPKHKQTSLQYSSCNRIRNLKEQMFQNCQYLILQAWLTGLFKFYVEKCGSVIYKAFKILLIIK